MRYIEYNTIENYLDTHYIEHFGYKTGEVILLLPYSADNKILVGINRIPFLHFMHIPYSVTSYEFFEYDLPIKYTLVNGECVITDIEQIKSYLISFSEMVLSILKSGGTQTLYISQEDQRNLDFAIKHKSDKESIPPSQFNPTSITLGKIHNMNGDYEIYANAKTIFIGKNEMVINKVWNVLQNVLNVFINNLSRRLH